MDTSPTSHLCNSQDNINIIKNQENDVYQNGFIRGKEVGFLEGVKKHSLDYKKKNDQLLSTMNNLLIDFERSVSLFDDLMSSRVLDLALMIVKQVFKDTSLSNSEILLKNIKKIFNKEKFSLKNPVLFSNSKDQLLIKKYFGKIFDQYKWTIRIDDSLRSGDFLISSQDLMLDARVSTYLDELFQLAFLKKNKN